MAGQNFVTFVFCNQASFTCFSLSQVGTVDELIFLGNDVMVLPLGRLELIGKED